MSNTMQIDSIALEEGNGIHYYNREITKNNKEITRSTSSSSGLEAFASPGFAVASLSPDESVQFDFSHLSSEEGQEGEGEPLDSGACGAGLDAKEEPEIAASDSIKQEYVKRCLVQLFDNGPEAKQRYKLKVNLNLILPEETKEETCEFIAALTHRRENFKKYAPYGTKEWMIQWSDSCVKEIKEICPDAKPKRGKFHLNQGYSPTGAVFSQCEPWCQCVVFYKSDVKAWVAIINFFEFELMIELGDFGITDKQKKVGVHKQKLWMNPIHYPAPQRPKTWAQQRFGKK